jgi:hypothetical protein
MGVAVKGKEGATELRGSVPFPPRLFSDVTDYNLFCNFTDSLEIFTRIFKIFRLSSKCNTKCTRMILFVTLRCVNDCLMRTGNLGKWAISLAKLNR